MKKQQSSFKEVARKLAHENKAAETEIAERAKNVVIFNAKEGTRDEDVGLIKDLQNHIGYDNGKELKFFRLGKKVDNKIRPLKIVFTTEENKQIEITILHSFEKNDNLLIAF